MTNDFKMYCLGNKEARTHNEVIAKSWLDSFMIVVYHNAIE